MTDAIIFTDEHRPYVQTFTATRDGKILAANVRPAFKDEIERLRAQNAQLLAALRPFAEYFDGDLATIGGGTLVSLQFNLQLFKDAKAAIAAAESEGE